MLSRSVGAGTGCARPPPVEHNGTIRPTPAPYPVERGRSAATRGSAAWSSDCSSSGHGGAIMTPLPCSPARPSLDSNAAAPTNPPTPPNLRRDGGLREATGLRAWPSACPGYAIPRNSTPGSTGCWSMPASIRPGSDSGDQSRSDRADPRRVDTRRAQSSSTAIARPSARSLGPEHRAVVVLTTTARCSGPSRASARSTSSRSTTDWVSSGVDAARIGPISTSIGRRCRIRV